MSLSFFDPRPTIGQETQTFSPESHSQGGRLKSFGPSATVVCPSPAYCRSWAPICGQATLRLCSVPSKCRSPLPSLLLRYVDTHLLRPTQTLTISMEKLPHPCPNVDGDSRHIILGQPSSKHMLTRVDNFANVELISNSSEHACFGTVRATPSKSKN